MRSIAVQIWWMVIGFYVGFGLMKYRHFWKYTGMLLLKTVLVVSYAVLTIPLWILDDEVNYARFKDVTWSKFWNHIDT